MRYFVSRHTLNPLTNVSVLRERCSYVSKLRVLILHSRNIPLFSIIIFSSRVRLATTPLYKLIYTYYHQKEGIILLLADTASKLGQNAIGIYEKALSDTLQTMAKF